MWNYIKDKLGNTVFDNEDELFARLAFEWQNIPPEFIHNCYSAFLARCIVCLNHNGESLSGKWNEVHAEHDKYRTKLVKIQTPNGVIYKYIEQEKIHFYLTHQDILKIIIIFTNRKLKKQ